MTEIPSLSEEEFLRLLREEREPRDRPNHGVAYGKTTEIADEC